jgi:hypothetical protein
MNKIIISMAAVSGLAIAAPAAAQYAGANLQVRVQQLQTEIQTGVQRGTISRAEAGPLRERLRQLTRLERQYARNGLTRVERQDLQTRIQNLRQQIRYAERSGDPRYDRDRDGDDDRYDRNDDNRDDRFDRNGDGRDDRFDRNGDGRDDRYERSNDGRYDRLDRNNDGWDDRDHDRDGRWDDDGYQEPARGGIGGIIDNVLGTGGLRVGQRAPSNLGALPYEYRGRYRDSNGAYFRSDGRSIYEIDARTQTVVRVHPMSR